MFNLIGIFSLALLMSACVSSAHFDMVTTPLQLAVGQPDMKGDITKPRKPDLKKVKELVEAGADVNKINAWGSALHAASRHGTPEIVAYLIAHGADVNTGDNAKRTPLMWAAQSGQFDIVKLLIEKGADVNVIDNLNNQSALSQAAFSGRYEIVTYLIDKGADVSKQAGAAYVEAAFGMGAMLKGDGKDIAQNGTQKDKKTFEFIAILELMKSKGASVNSVDKQGRNALHLPATMGNVRVVRYFLKAGVDPNIEVKYIGTPLKAAQAQKDS